MDEVLRFFRVYEGLIYGLILLGAAIYLRQFVSAWRDMRSTIFGLERESAQARLNQATTVLITLILVGIAEFVLVTYVVPLRPQSIPLATPTIDPLATATATLAPPEPGGEIIPGEIAPTPTFDARIGSCIAGSVEITSPQPGDQVNEAISIIGSAKIESFGFYKLEIAPQDEVNWRTIQAGRDVIENGVLVEKWDPSTLAPGTYLLRIVVTDTNGDSLPDCRVPITITTP